MRVFDCNVCGHAVYFSNTRCVRCDNMLAFDPIALAMRVPDRPVCQNSLKYGACNWLASDSSVHGYCVACELNRTVPDLDNANNAVLWKKIQFEKNHLIYSLLRFALPVVSRTAEPNAGLAFDFLNANDSEPGHPVQTGHKQGVITLDISEADDAQRESTRLHMDEPYRTLLGHFRHESAHYYWDRLVRDTPWLDQVRSVFGDDRVNYQNALAQHYEQGPPCNWAADYISAYASSHAWEDWAETWAHYFHIVDTLDSASALGMKLDPDTGRVASAPLASDMDPYHADSVGDLIDRWLPISVALNMLNRSLGQPDAYPFVLSTRIIEKLSLVHAIIAGHRAQTKPSVDNRAQ